MYIWLFRFKFWGNIWDKYSHLPLCLCISILLALTQVHCGVITGKTKISAEQKYLTKQDFSKCRFFFFFLLYLRAQQGSMVSSSAKDLGKWIFFMMYLNLLICSRKVQVYADNLTDHPVFQIAFQHQCTARVTCMELACPKYVRIRVDPSMESNLWTVRTVTKYSYYRNILWL